MAEKRKLKCDVVVVGSGPGGATVAKDLTSKGKDIIILEWGRDNPPHAGMVIDIMKYLGGFGRRKHIMLKPENSPISIVRGITTGGCTMAFGGISYDPPVDEFAGHGFDLSREVEEIKKEIHIQPLPDNFLGPRGKIIMESAMDLGFKWKKHDRMLKDPSKCRYGDNSAFLGDKTGSRWCARDWVMEAVNGGASLMNETFCEEVIIDGGKAVGVIAKDKKGGEIEIGADKVVIAAGGIGSPLILQKSGIHEAGRSFFVDPYLQVFGHVDKKIEQVKEPIRQAGVLIEEDGIILGDGALPSPVYKQVAFRSAQPGKVFKAKNVLTILVEIADELTGSVSAAGEILKKLTEEDQAKLDKGIILAQKILHNAGAKDIWSSKLIGGVHLGGTCKIGDIVDSNLKTRIDNLYVGDSSVLPKALARPPVLTIMALAKRLAKQLC